MGNERLDEFVLRGGWREDDDESQPELDRADRADIGSDIASQYNSSAQSFRYLQTLIAGEGAALPIAPPSVRIVLARKGWREDYALVYGFPPSEAAEDSDVEAPTYSAHATRFPEEAVQFKVYYGANYGAGGYSRVEVVQSLDPETAGRLKAGDFTDEEAERILAESSRLIEMYWELNVAARDSGLNPGYAERVNEAFYQNAAAAGF